MNEIVQLFKEWPVVVQGALGSALFWVFLNIAQYLFNVIGEIVSMRTNWARRYRLVTELSKYNAYTSKEWDKKVYHVSVVAYRSLRSLYKALIWLTGGLVIDATVGGVFAVAGYVGCLFYLLSASGTVAPINVSKSQEEIEQVMEDMQQELNDLKEHNKALVRDAGEKPPAPHG